MSRVEVRIVEPTDEAVRSIAAVFAANGWQWTTWAGRSRKPFVPGAKRIAMTLNQLAESVTLMGSRGGRSRTGHLFVARDVDSLTFGIEWWDEG